VRLWIASAFAQVRFGGRGRRFAPRNDGGETRVHVLAACFARALHLDHPLEKQRAQGRPGGRCTRGPRARKIARRARDHRYRRRHSGLPCAVVYGLYELSSVNLRLPPSPSRSFSAIREGLAPALARQDHTTSPSVSMLHVSSIFASTAFRSTFVTIAIRPLCQCGTGRVKPQFSEKRKANIFRARAGQTEAAEI
jgi:hypothetical protein